MRTRIVLLNLSLVFLLVPAVLVAAEDSAGLRASFESAEEAPSTPERKVNLQTSPMGLLFRRYNAAVEVGVSQSVAMGLKGTFYPSSRQTGIFDSASGYEAGLRTTWYPMGERFTDGIILRGGFFWGDWRTNNDLADAFGNALVTVATAGLAQNRYKTLDVVKGPVLEFMAGYQMVFGAGFNFDWNVGLTGYQRSREVINLDTGNRTEYESKKARISAVVELNVGYSF